MTHHLNRDPLTGRWAKITTRVFVYGTLMKGHGNNRLLARARFLGKATTTEEYTMLYGGIPWVIPPVQGLQKGRVAGEVYEVTSAELAALDRLEGYHPAAPVTSCHYVRTPIDVRYDGVSGSVRASIYLGGPRVQAYADPDSNHVLPDEYGVLRYPGIGWEEPDVNDGEDYARRGRSA